MCSAMGTWRKWRSTFNKVILMLAVTALIAEPGGVNTGLKFFDLAGGKPRFRFPPISSPESAQTGPIPYANGGGSFFRRRLFHQLGGFHHHYSPFYWEDADLGWRAWKLGWTPIALTPTCRRCWMQKLSGMTALT